MVYTIDDGSGQNDAHRLHLKEEGNAFFSSEANGLDQVGRFVFQSGQARSAMVAIVDSVRFARLGDEACEASVVQWSSLVGSGLGDCFVAALLAMTGVGWFALSAVGGTHPFCFPP